MHAGQQPDECLRPSVEGDLVVTAGRLRVGEHPVGDVQDRVDDLGRDGVGHLPQRAEPRRTRFGRSASASTTMSAASSGVIVGNLS